MAVANMDVGFEKYIIFHRGVKDFYINEKSQLVGVYQDGEERVMGDPLGDEGREKVEKAIDAGDKIESKLSEMNDKIAAANELLKVSLPKIKEETIAAQQAAETAKNEAKTEADAIKGSNANLQRNVTELREAVTALQNNIVYLDSDTPPAGIEGMIWLKPKHNV